MKIKIEKKKNDKKITSIASTNSLGKIKNSNWCLQNCYHATNFLQTLAKPSL
jgi:hypothetical protein